MASRGAPANLLRRVKMPDASPASEFATFVVASKVSGTNVSPIAIDITADDRGRLAEVSAVRRHLREEREGRFVPRSSDRSCGADSIRLISGALRLRSSRIPNVNGRECESLPSSAPYTTNLCTRSRRELEHREITDATSSMRCCSR